MPRFVKVRNIKNSFDAEHYFSHLTIQKNRNGKPVCGNEVIKIGDESYNFSFAQFESYDEWLIALQMNGLNDYDIQCVEQFPYIDPGNTQYEIDRAFAEAEAMDHPRATCVYSICNK